MRNEDLEHALLRARAATRPLRERRDVLRNSTDHLKRRQTELETKGRPDEADEYRQNAKYLYDFLQEKRVLGSRLKAAQELEAALNHLPSSWTVAMPGVGVFSAYFLVRTYRIEEGKPVAYEPFWLETFINDPSDRDKELLALHALWASGRPLRPGGTGPSDPLIGAAKPFGPETEAARINCGACAASAYVIGWKDLCHWIGSEEDDTPYRQALYALCLACPSLKLLAERADHDPLKLHP